MLGRGYGADLIQESDGTAGSTDVLRLMSGVTQNQLWFRQLGNNLEVSIIGTADTATVQNWYVVSQYHVEQLKTSDSKTLLDSKVQSLVKCDGVVRAASGGTDDAAHQLSDDVGARDCVIAANWWP